MRNRKPTLLLVTAVAIATCWLVFFSLDRRAAQGTPLAPPGATAPGQAAQVRPDAPASPAPLIVRTPAATERFVEVLVREAGSARPIAGATAMLTRRGQRMVAADAAAARATTDEEGLARLLPAQLEDLVLCVHKAGFIPAAAVESLTWGSRYVLELDHAHRLVLEFVSREGRPIPGVGVRMSQKPLRYGFWSPNPESIPCGNTQSALFEASSDAAGRVEFDSLAPGDYWVSTFSPEHAMLDAPAMRKLTITGTHHERIEMARLFGIAVELRGTLAKWKCPARLPGSLHAAPFGAASDTISWSRAALAKRLGKILGQQDFFVWTYAFDEAGERQALDGQVKVPFEAWFANRDPLSAELVLAPIAQVSPTILDEGDAVPNALHGFLRIELVQPDGAPLAGYPSFSAIRKDDDELFLQVPTFQDRPVAPGSYTITGPKSLGALHRAQVDIVLGRTTTHRIQLTEPYALLRLELVPDLDLAAAGCWVAVTSPGRSGERLMVDDSRDLWLPAGHTWRVTASRRNVEFFAQEVSLPSGPARVVRIPIVVE